MARSAHITDRGHRAAVVASGGAGVAFPRTAALALERLMPLAAVAILPIVALAAVRATGGSPNSLNHLGYPGIILAAYLFGWKGAVVSAAVTSFLLGPFPRMAGLEGGLEGPQAWLIRASMFLLVGAVTGALFTRMRHARDAWHESAMEVAESRRSGIVALARGAEAKDQTTGDHVVRVQSSAELLAAEAGLPDEVIGEIGLAAMLHDVGKLHVPDRILQKRDSLTDEEWEIMRAHSVWGGRILTDGAGFELARKVARWHHENFDGTGYPDGLRGANIPLEARIVRIADAFDAMTHDRPYRRARSLDEALDEIRRYAGTAFDPELAEVFVDLMDRDGRAAGKRGTRYRP